MSSGEVWITAREALTLLKPLGHWGAVEAICKRAHNDMIKSRAERFMVDKVAKDDVEIPPKFWWAEGHAALKQNWDTGDFDTWIDRTVHLQAFGVSFLRKDIVKLVPPDVARAETSKPAAPAEVESRRVGRPKADWWDDLWVEICRQLYEGELIPKTAADIERAMLDWLTAKTGSANESTVRPRARKLWKAIKDKN